MYVLQDLYPSIPALIAAVGGENGMEEVARIRGFLREGEEEEADGVRRFLEGEWVVGE